MKLHAEPLETPKLAFTNCGYLNPDDFATLALEGGCDPSSLPTAIAVQFGRAVFVCRGRAGVTSGTIQMNKFQRTAADVTMSEIVDASMYPVSTDITAASVTFAVDSLSRGRGTAGPVLDGKELEATVAKVLAGHILTNRQEFCIEHHGQPLRPTVREFAHVSLDGTTAPAGSGSGASAGAGAGGFSSQFALFSKATAASFEKSKDSTVEIRGGTKKTASLFEKGFNFQKLGIGGLDAEFASIFRRAFASRLYPQLMRDFGMNHVRGMLLYGAPGCGKTLIARKIGEALHSVEPKKVNGPEILNKYVGQSEENIRELFAEAEADQKAHGDDSELHIIIFDEIDAICKQRGSSRDGTGVHDSIVNQLLSKIDGVDSLNNILLIGMTNRRDLIDEALLRPGRLEVHVEIGLPDEAGRAQILNIHTSKIRSAGRLADDVDIHELATLTKNYTGAELEGLVKDALSYALMRAQSGEDFTVAADTSSIQICRQDLLNAIAESTPAFGMRESDLKDCYRNGIVSHGPEFEDLMTNLRAFTKQVTESTRTPMLSVMLEGVSGAGKSAISCMIGVECGFPFVKRVSADTLVGRSDDGKAAAIQKVFEDAYKTPLSCIILDDIERLLGYVPLGQRFSNTVLQVLLVLVKRPPPSDRRCFIIGTTSNPVILDQMGLLSAFNVTLTVPALRTTDSIAAVLSDSADVEQKDVAAMAGLISGSIPIKQLLLVLEMARQEADVVTVDAFTRACHICGVETKADFALP